MTPSGSPSALTWALPDIAVAQRDRQRIRRGEHHGNTAGLAPGFVQGNLVILPANLANDFLLYCQRNPQPCPLLAVGEPGNPMMPALGLDIDIRSDLPSYRVWRDGELAEQPQDISALWRDDLVGFVIGCSFSFEQALMESGVPLRHIETGCNVSMYRTNIQTAPAGAFHGPLVVSMRPMRPADVIRAVQITSRFPRVHGAPVHIGLPHLIGINDLSKPDYGDPVRIGDDELPVFWACGVTPQAAVMATRPPLCITHSPGCMLITDELNLRLASF